MPVTSAEMITLAAQYITLTESRRGFRGNCPFHQDTAGSMMVSPEKNIFKCFGCGKEGGPKEFQAAISVIK